MSPCLLVYSFLAFLAISARFYIDRTTVELKLARIVLKREEHNMNKTRRQGMMLL